MIRGFLAVEEIVDELPSFDGLSDLGVLTKWHQKKAISMIERADQFQIMYAAKYFKPYFQDIKFSDPHIDTLAPVMVQLDEVGV